MKKSEIWRKILILFHHYFVFFAVVAFFITCCMTLFISTMTATMGISLTSEHISTAAKLTFVNVVILSLLITIIDEIRRKISVERPVKRITEAAQKIMEGDFSVRIKPTSTLYSGGTFNEIIVCMNQMAEELSGIETLRTDFTANVSHELKTPLSVMQNYGTLLQKPGLSEEKRIEYAKVITDSSRKMADLVSNILKLNKLENQQIFPDVSTYDLGEQLCECLLSFEDIWETKGLQIQTDIEDNVLVKADSEMMALVWNNLFSNAIKFTENGGLISLRLFTEKDDAYIQIADTGCGISKEVGMHMFDKFYQGDTSHAMQGNGLGLALVKRIIDITGSEISVESQLQKGTTFTVKMRRENSGTIQETTA